jgi:acyl-CoA reductase-like NAD-dependent aldehyde dehydrogenase
MPSRRNRDADALIEVMARAQAEIQRLRQQRQQIRQSAASLAQRHERELAEALTREELGPILKLYRDIDILQRLAAVSDDGDEA